MQEELIEKKEKAGKFKRSLSDFFSAFFLAAVFVLVCLPFFSDMSDPPYRTAESLRQINLWRLVAGSGALCFLATAVFAKKQKRKLAIFFLWFFWLAGASWVFFSVGFQLKNALLTVPEIQTKNLVSNTLAIFPFLAWALLAYFCQEIAEKLGTSKMVAVLAGIFLPGVSFLLYVFLAFRSQGREQKIKVFKSVLVSAFLFLIFFVSLIFFVLGTPEYSLYKLENAIKSNEQGLLEKHLDIEKVAQSMGKTKEEMQEEIEQMSFSVFEFKEENSNKGKNDDFYVPSGLTGKNLEEARVYLSGEENSTPLVFLKFDPEGARMLFELTERNLGKTLAAFVDGELVATLSIEEKRSNGEILFELDFSGIEQAESYVQKINSQKNGKIDGLKIKKREVAKDLALIELEDSDGGIIKIRMDRLDGRQWQIVGAEFFKTQEQTKLPSAQGEKIVKFVWSYKGKEYVLEEKLYDSFYQFYGSLPAEVFFNGESELAFQERNNELFLKKIQGESTIEELAKQLKWLAEKDNLSEDQTVELVTRFVQTIPYDYEELKNIDSGQHKVDYPYEVLYENKGICSDKSYLTYVLLRELGYGVSFFLFPEDRHIAVGVQCPVEYSNYDSSYCFLETTSLGNKIGSKPSILQETRVASANVEFEETGGDSSEDQAHPLGRLEILNKTQGKVYSGVIETFNTQKKIESMKTSLETREVELKALIASVNAKEAQIRETESELKKLSKSKDPDDYEEYKDLYDDYEEEFYSFDKAVKNYNSQVKDFNSTVSQYNAMLNDFYE